MSSAPLRPPIAVDSTVWIHWFEQDARFLPSVESVLAPVLAGSVGGVTSVIAVLEVLTGAIKRGNEVLARRYQELFSSTQAVLVLDFHRDLAVEAARLRIRYNLETPDAIHIATAIAAGASEFVTTDRRLARVKEIPVRVLKPSSVSRKTTKRS